MSAATARGLAQRASEAVSRVIVQQVVAAAASRVNLPHMAAAGAAAALIFAPARAHPNERFLDLPIHPRIRPAPYPEQFLPRENPPVPEGFALNVVKQESEQGIPPAKSPVPASPVARPREVGSAIAACWAPPAATADNQREITVRLSFRRDGSILGQPRVAYVEAENENARATLRQSLLDSVQHCAPIKFTPSMGRAVAGRLFAIHFTIARQPTGMGGQKETFAK